jgi:hypothetical protein
LILRTCCLQCLVPRRLISSKAAKPLDAIEVSVELRGAKLSFGYDDAGLIL